MGDRLTRWGGLVARWMAGELAASYAYDMIDDLDMACVDRAEAQRLVEAVLRVNREACRRDRAQLLSYELEEFSYELDAEDPLGDLKRDLDG